MELKGIIVKIGDIETISDKFSKREIVIETPGDYPQKISCQVSNKTIGLFDGKAEGQEVTASINIKGREHNGKYYNTIEIWKVI
jgi:single-strand DNA-binding protein